MSEIIREGGPAPEVVERFVVLVISMCDKPHRGRRVDTLTISCFYDAKIREVNKRLKTKK